VLDPHWHRHRGKRAAAALEALAGELGEAVRFWIADAGEGGLGVDDLAPRLGWTADATRALLAAQVAAGEAVRFDAGPGHGERWLAVGALRGIEERARRILAAYFKRHPTQGGMPRAEALAALFPGAAAPLAAAHLRWLSQRGALEVRGDKVGVPGRGAELSGGESKLASGILAAYEAAGLTPPPPAEIRAALGAKAQILDGVISYLLDQGRLVRLPGDLLISAAALDTLRAELTRLAPERLTVGDFKERFGLTRKWAIPLLEHLDSVGFTRRVGNERQIVRR
jgi:selenocysteine-specific elongation factor